MMKIKLFTTILCSFMLFELGCSNEKEPNVIDKGEEQPVYPVEIEIQDYTWQGISCSWQYSKLKADSVYQINTYEELTAVVSCKENDMPDIDFYKYSLLLARGGTTSGIHAFEKQLQQISVSEYCLYVDITLNAATVAQVWSISIKVPKLSQNAVVSLNKNEHP